MNDVACPMGGLLSFVGSAGAVPGSGSGFATISSHRSVEEEVEAAVLLLVVLLLLVVGDTGFTMTMPSRLEAVLALDAVPAVPPNSVEEVPVLGTQKPYKQVVEAAHGTAHP